ncbi:MAG: hypothetical protein H6908_05485 [Hyphomicrobiales bacterium]|nr:hypothetical protein [Hyphomicrobiales bacterium]
MYKLFLKFWPALIPIMLYVMWRLMVRYRRVQGEDEALAEHTAKVWIWTLLSSIAILLISVGYMLFSESPREEGTHVPVQYEDGKPTSYNTRTKRKG